MGLHVVDGMARPRAVPGLDNASNHAVTRTWLRMLHKGYFFPDTGHHFLLFFFSQQPYQQPYHHPATTTRDTPPAKINTSNLKKKIRNEIKKTRLVG